MKQKQKMTSGLDSLTGELIDIDNFNKATGQVIVCPACGSTLVAKKGKQTMHHFAHSKGANCENGYEVSLVYQIKKSIEQNGFLIEERFFNKLNDLNKIKLSNEKIVFPDEIELRNDFSQEIPNLKLIFGDKKIPDIYLITEMSKTFDQNNLVGLEERDMTSVFSFDIRNVESILTEKHIKEILTTTLRSDHRRWIIDREHDNNMRIIERLCDVTTNQRTMPCPLRKFNDVRPVTCSNCPYNFKRASMVTLPHILCFGRIRINNFDVIKTIKNVKYGVIKNNYVESISLKNATGQYKDVKLHVVFKDSTLKSLDDTLSIKEMWNVARQHFTGIDKNYNYYDINVINKKYVILKYSKNNPENKVKINNTNILINFVNWGER